MGRPVEGPPAAIVERLWNRSWLSDVVAIGILLTPDRRRLESGWRIIF